MAVKPFDVSAFSRADFIDPKEAGYRDSIEIIYEELQKTRKSFIKIGWYLKHINETEMYAEDGYGNIYEFARDKYNISQSTATRFINLCTEFSVGHDSPELDERYMDFSVSQLFEMLPMKEDEKEQVTPDMTVKEIREIKKDNKTEIREPDNAVIMAFYDNHLNPRGNEEKKDLKGYMLARYGKMHVGGGPDPNFACTPRGIKLENFDEITWTNFVKRVNELFPDPEEEPEGRSAEGAPAEPGQDDDIPGQTSIEKDFPEYMPADSPVFAGQERESVIDGEYREVEEKSSEETVKGEPYKPPQEPELRKSIDRLIDSISDVFGAYAYEELQGAEWTWAEIPVERLETAKKDALLLVNEIEKLSCLYCSRLI